MVLSYLEWSQMNAMKILHLMVDKHTQQMTCKTRAEIKKMAEIGRIPTCWQLYEDEIDFGSIHKLRWRNFENFWSPPPSLTSLLNNKLM